MTSPGTVLYVLLLLNFNLVSAVPGDSLKGKIPECVCLRYQQLAEREYKEQNGQLNNSPKITSKILFRRHTKFAIGKTKKKYRVRTVGKKKFSRIDKCFFS